jgi:hypothetical protein
VSSVPCAWLLLKSGATQVAAGSPPRVSSRSPAFTTGRRGTLMISPRGAGMQSPAGLCRTPAVRLPPVSRSQAAGDSGFTRSVHVYLAAPLH